MQFQTDDSNKNPAQRFLLIFLSNLIDSFPNRISRSNAEKITYPSKDTVRVWGKTVYTEEGVNPRVTGMMAIYEKYKDLESKPQVGIPTEHTKAPDRYLWDSTDGSVLLVKR